MKYGENKARPFVKWAGGKGMLLPALEELLPSGMSKLSNLTYMEPFVGGGAMLFYLLREYPNITRAVINDINKDLTSAYKTVKDEPLLLIEALKNIQGDYRSLTTEEKRREYYLAAREKFNAGKNGGAESTALFIFLNRTCFNGLYRVNSKGKFNVPFGRYTNPLICDEALIKADSELLQKVEILCGDFQQTEPYADGNTFIYMDPPYHPLSGTANFTSYSAEGFGEGEQIRLKAFFDRLGSRCLLMESNADCTAANPENTFIERLYDGYETDKIMAPRFINSDSSKRGKITELVIRNYRNDRESGPVQVKLDFTPTTDPMKAHTPQQFSEFISQLQETNATLGFYCDFEKIGRNVDTVSLKLHQLNYLIGKEDTAEAVRKLWNENPTVFSALHILIAVRDHSKKVLCKDGTLTPINSFFQTPEGVVRYMEETGLKEIFRDKKITSLVDYVFGVETGLDTNARKNRSGKIMERIIEDVLLTHKIRYRKQVKSSEFPEIASCLGKDQKTFDFAVYSTAKTYLTEVNFYSTSGSKLNEVARSYSDIAPKINSRAGYEFVWITDGVGWHKASAQLEEAYYNIPGMYNLTTLHEFIERIAEEEFTGEPCGGKNSSDNGQNGENAIKTLNI